MTRERDDYWTFAKTLLAGGWPRVDVGGHDFE